MMTVLSLATRDQILVEDLLAAQKSQEVATMIVMKI